MNRKIDGHDSGRLGRFKEWLSEVRSLVKVLPPLILAIAVLISSCTGGGPAS